MLRFLLRNSTIAALADVNRPEDALPIVRNLLQNDNPEQRRQTISKSVIEKLSESINRQDNKETIADQLCSEITGSVPGSLGFNQGMETRPRTRLAASWGRQGQQQQSPRNWRQDRPGMRPGLSELE
ncbi:hypothetical protein B566_EDAN015064 [Ephemera danica]|nr:hypothetical protein B566_EDAN015064 [Ephemera danica]